ncbi:hypothetical protein, variant [Aphanomyces invadans]|uniref:F-box domain-containing protein n=1 Tax=Aphanomyces invadans TaxID=157072 RepID=A0A024TL67_9STRA|nr:hypothetical protein, variant [Aphanomyces invadans]XP_008877295.1 hypothetical protein H310_12110 [Aphanomyces invadans]ETV94091.1 hypothetical protein H310_12110 [Aphanomyces invadans]ETV94092.1 hypothetical protein, variant [Aphanomyces invadans]|eukprot:XP_008877294.1 hypothetical protein, variant [Aphanomyces invadans]
MATIAEPPRVRTRRDEAAEELERALNESLQPDFLAQIVDAEWRMRYLAVSSPAPSQDHLSTDGMNHTLSDENETGVDDDDTTEDSAGENTDLTEVRIVESAFDDDVNASVPICHLPERMLQLVLEYLDEDSIGLFSSTCHRFHAVARTDLVWAMMCHRVFSIQAKGRPVQLRRYKSWMHMFFARPRVKYHGFYVLRLSYYKKPEINMWSDLPKNAILQAIYYRYFCFHRNGTVLYAMTHRHPREMGEAFRTRSKDVWEGTYSFHQGQLHVVAHVGHSIVQFKFRVTSRWRAPNTRLVLQTHAIYSPNDTALRHPHEFDTADEEFNYRRHWKL